MPSFVAEEVERHHPMLIEEPLARVADGNDCNVYYFRSRTEDVRSVLQPGRFNFMRDNFKSGSGGNRRSGVEHFIQCVLGEREDGLTVVMLHVLDLPTSPTLGNVTVAKGDSRKYTPCRHDGSAVVVEPTPKDPKAAERKRRSRANLKGTS